MPSSIVIAPLTQKKLTFTGVGSGGIFDPSVTKDPTTGKLWMSYSAVEPSYNGGYAAPALFETTSGVYFIATPTVQPDALYKGCTIFKFANLDTALFEKTSGVPTIVKKIEGTSNLFRGACGYNGSATASDVMLSELSSLTDGIFQIFLTRAIF